MSLYVVNEGSVSTHYIKKEDQLADIGTKSISKRMHHYFLKVIQGFMP